MTTDQISDLDHRNDLFFLCQKIFVGLLSESEKLEKLSQWLLFATGGAAALVISNLSEVALLTSRPATKAVLLLMGASMALGLIQKFVAVYIQVKTTFTHVVHVEFNKFVESNMSRLTVSKIERLGSGVASQILASIPNWLRFFVEARTDPALDPLGQYRHLARTLIVQGFLFTLQFLAIVAALLKMGFSIS